ncbi:hypothetical protein T492DRAFT_901975, partial [Pavlovales sp. CCMP2436]
RILSGTVSAAAAAADTTAAAAGAASGAASATSSAALLRPRRACGWSRTRSAAATEAVGRALGSSTRSPRSTQT